MNVGYINPDVRAMYGIPYSQLTDEQKAILHADSVRRATLIEDIQREVIENNRRAFEDEARMERVLAQIYRSTQQEILASVTETIAKVQRDGGTWSYANQSALTRSRGLFEQITRELTNLGVKEQITFTQGLSSIYTDQFLRSVYTLGQSVPVRANFNRLNPALIRKILDYPWSGAMFSDRLWIDKEQLGRNLRIGLTQSMILGESIPQITDRITKGIDTSRYNAERVARTETKRVTYCAHKDAYEDSGVKELEYRCANGGDSRTCPICKADQGKHYVEGKEPTLPRHPNCRCVYIPVVSDTFGDNELNELTGSVRGAENYEKWKEAQEKQLKKDEVITPEEEKKQKVLTELDNNAKAVQDQINAKQAEYDTLDNQYRSYSTVRRGLQTPQEAGFTSKAEFNALDKQLQADITKAKEELERLQRELRDIALDKRYVMEVEGGADNLQHYQRIREALRDNSTFDYDKYADELLSMVERMDEDALAIHKALGDIVENANIYSYRGRGGAHYSPYEHRVNMDISSNTHERALGNGLNGSWQTKYHEEGHQLDHLLCNVDDISGGATNTSFLRAFTSPATATGKEIQRALESDLLGFVNEAIGYYNGVHSKDTGFKTVKDLTAFTRIPREVRYAFDEYYRSLTSGGMDKRSACQLGIVIDALGLFTEDRLSRNTLSCSGWGHDSSYNKDRGKAGSASETWATFCALRTCGSEDEQRIARTIMPSTWAVMDDIYHKIAVYVATHKLSY